MLELLPCTKRCLAKLLLMLLISHLCLSISGQSTGRVAPKITLSGNSITLNDVFKAIRKQTGKIVWYMNDELDPQKKVNVKFQNATVEEVMKFLFESSDLTWNLDDERIILRKKKSVTTDTNISADPKNVGREVTLSEDSDSVLSTITVKGKVIDEKGSPIIGATVVVKGGKVGTTTGQDGGFVLGNVEKKARLVVSSIGFITEEVYVQGTPAIGEVRLKAYVGALDETVVIAYGTTTRRLSTGNISTVKAEEIARQPVNNPLLALQGRVPGLIVTQSSGLSGSGVTVRIQGQNSIDRGSDPFYVIDGVPYNSQLLPSVNPILGPSGGAYTGSTYISSSGNPFSFINPADIESIDILKDADATAIYGSRAANGAILITTKKGKSGQTKIDVTMQSGWGRVTRKMDLLNTEQYLEMRKEAYLNDGLTIPTSLIPEDQKNASNYDLTIWDNNRYTDWQKELVGGTARYSDIQASVSGGNEQTIFRLNGGYHRETTVFPGDFSDQKGSLGFSLNHSSVNKKFKLQFSGNYLSDDNQIPATDLTRTALNLAPNAPTLYKPDGSLNWERIPSGTDSLSTWTSPLASLIERYRIKTDNLLGNTTLSYTILPRLNIKTSIGLANMNTNELSIGPSTAKAPESRSSSNRYAYYGNGKTTSWIIEPQLAYNFNLSKGYLDILVGSTLQQNNNHLKQFAGIGYTSDQVLEDFTAASALIPTGNVQSIYKYAALFARLNYNWKDKYILNLTARRDGSSRFGIENQMHNFGAVGAAWLFSNETFVKNGSPFLSSGKLRASYGTTGNDQIGDYQFLNQYIIVSQPNPYQGFTGLTPQGIPNPYIQWELTKKLQAGLDFGILKDRILVQINYFRNRSSNQLLSYGLPMTSGFNGVFRNFPATIQNSGWEFSVNTINIQNTSFTWTSNFNLTIPKNRLLDFPNLISSTYANRLVIGEPIKILKLYNFAGVDPQTGLYQYYAADKSITATPNNTKDNTYLFDAAPKFYGGIQNTISFKGFQFDATFQFVKQSARNYALGLTNIVGWGYSNQPKTVLQRWQNQGDNSGIQKYSTTISASNAQSSDVSYADASYIRLKNVALSWELPSNWKSRIHLQNCRIFLHGQNLLTFTNYTGLDPENLSIAQLPPLKIWTMGLHIGL